jgi:chromosome segregation ATPase
LFVFLLFLQVVSRKLKQLQLSVAALEASQRACRTQAARVAGLRPQAIQLTAQVAELQAEIATGSEQKTQVQQQLDEKQDELCSREQQVQQLQGSMETLQDKVGDSMYVINCMLRQARSAASGVAC